MNSIRRKGLEKLSSLLDIELNYSHAKHNFELGLPLEGSLRKFFRPYFPNRYGFSSGYIVDRNEKTSNQTDWIIFDAEHFAPLMAQLHGIEGAEWFPFDAVYGTVEVKRSLTEASLTKAVKQIAGTKKLERESTSLLQVSPYLRIPREMLNTQATFDETCNELYSGIYAFQSDEFKEPGSILNSIEQLSKEYGIKALPDFIAVHGRYYIRRAVYDEQAGYKVQPFLDQNNSYIAIHSGIITSGIFYVDLLSTFANTQLLARNNTQALYLFLESSGLLKDIKGKIYKK